MDTEQVYVDDNLFLGRIEEQKALREVLSRLLRSPEPDATSSVFLLYGEGGMGKSQLLRRFRDIAQLEAPWERALQILVVDWEVERGRHLGLQVSRDRVAAETVLEILAQSAEDIGGKSALKPFRTAAQQLREVETKVRESFQRDRADDRWAGLRGLAAESAATWLRRLVGVGEGLQAPVTKGIDNALELTGDAATTALTWFRSRLRLKSEEERLFCRPEEELARALGRGFAAMSKSRPLIILLDTYEIVDRVDPWLRLVIREAGPRLVWVLAGRDNLRDSRPADRFIGYSAELPRQLYAIDLQELSISDVAAYLRFRAPERQLSEDEAVCIHQATLGIPLAIRQAGDLWARDVPLEVFAEAPGGADRDDIVRTMSERVLIHCFSDTEGDREDRRALYLLAMQRRSDPQVQRAALAPAEGRFDLNARWVELARRYSAVQRGQQVVLHAKVAGFLREFLLSPQERQSDVVHELASRAADAVRRSIERIEEDLPLLEDRCDSDDWKEAVLDLLSWLFWKDPAEAWREWLPTFVAGRGYNSELAEGLVELAGRFEPAMGSDDRKRLLQLRHSLTGDGDSWEAVLADCRIRLRRFSDSVGQFGELNAILDVLEGDALQQRAPQTALELLLRAESGLPAEGRSLKEELSNSFLSLAYSLVWAKGLSSPVDSPEAEQLLRKVMAWFPKQDEAWNLLGVALHSGSRPEAAYACFRQAADLAPHHLLYLSNTGYALDKLMRYDEATACFQRVLETEPNNTQAHNGLGWVQFHLRRYDHALRCFQRALEIEPNNLEAHNGLGATYSDLQQYEEAIRTFKRALEIKLDDPEAYSGLGWVHYFLRRYDEATRYFHRALEIEPTLLAANLGAGRVCSSLRRYDEATHYFQRALEIKPDHSTANSGLGWVHYSLRRYDEATRFFQRVLEIEPNNSEAHNGLGWIYNLLWRYDEATRSFQRALEIDPNNLGAQRGLGLAHFYQLQSKKAIKILTRLTEIDPSNGGAWNDLGLYLSAVGETAQAIATLEKSIATDPALAKPHRHLGKIHLIHGRLLEGIACLERAVHLDSEYSAAHASLAVAYRRMGRAADAERHLQLASQFLERSDDYNRATYEAVAGNTAGALRQLEEVFRFAPGYRLVARRDPDLDGLRANPSFQQLIGMESQPA